MTGDVPSFEIAIVGGGPVGACAAALLARHAGIAPQRILLLAPDAEAAGEIVAGSAPELRVSAIADASRRILMQAGAWECLPPQRLCAYERMRIWHQSMPPDGPDSLVFDAAELALPDLGVIAENHALTAASLASFRASGGKLCTASLLGFSCDNGAVQLQTSAGAMRAQLLVGADGARSQVREALGIPVRTHAYHQQAIVATVATARPHQHTAWQRFLDTGPLALLPLFDGSCSIVWTADGLLAQELMSLPPAEFTPRLEAAADGVLGRMQLCSERFAVPLQRATATRLVAPRAALIGDAAHQIHPLAGQGVNLGLLDAAALCEAVIDARREGEDPGSLRALRRYEQTRLAHDTLMSWTMSAFNTLFSRAGLAGWAGARLLGVAGASAFSRRLLARRAMGLAGELPRLAR
jgi:2-octaprenylphenol hydroxylase